MYSYETDSSYLTQEQIDALGGDLSLIRTVRVWDPNDPEGWLEVGLGPSYGMVTCPKPCSRITDPPPIS